MTTAESVRNAVDEMTQAATDEMDEMLLTDLDEPTRPTNKSTSPPALALANALMTWMSSLPDLGEQETAWIWWTPLSRPKKCVRSVQYRVWIRFHIPTPAVPASPLAFLFAPQTLHWG